jgi:hypothetical protein
MSGEVRSARIVTLPSLVILRTTNLINPLHTLMQTLVFLCGKINYLTTKDHEGKLKVTQRENIRAVQIN